MIIFNYMTQSTRRRFLTGCLAVPVAAFSTLRVKLAGQGLGQFGNSAAAPCLLDDKATPAVPAGKEFKPGSPSRTSLIEPGVAGPKLVLTGIVRGLTCGPIKGAVVDFWQADAQGVYDQAGFKLRGHQSTDAAGKYRLDTIVPGASGTRAPHLNARVTPPGKPVFTTRIFLPDAAQNKKDPAFKPELAMKVTEGRDGKTATFDIVLNL